MDFHGWTDLHRAGSSVYSLTIKEGGMMKRKDESKVLLLAEHFSAF